jgi:hypothetical protein
VHDEPIEVSIVRGEIAESDGYRSRRARERLAQRACKRKKLVSELQRHAVCGAEEKTTEPDRSHGTQELVGQLGSAGDGRAVGFRVAGEHRDPEVLASTPERLELLQCPLEQDIPAIMHGHEVLGVPDTPRPRAALLHHDERDTAHDNLPRRRSLHSFRVLGRHQRDLKAIGAPALPRAELGASIAESLAFLDAKGARNPELT